MKSIVAIEVSRDAIRAAEIFRPFSKNPSVAKIGEIEIAPGVAGESEMREIDKFVEALEKLWEEQGFSTKSVALVVSGRRFIVRNHQTAHRSMKTLKPVLPYEVATVVPESMQNPVIDFYPTGHLETKNGVMTSGLVVATPSDPIENLIGGLVRAKMKIEYVDFAPMAIARFIKNNIEETEENTYALANIRELSTDILVAKNNVPKMIRVAGVGLIPPQKKVGRHSQENRNIFESVQGQLAPIEIVAREIKVTLDSQKNESGNDVDTLYITGPRSDQDTIDALSKILKMKVVSLTTDTANQKSDLDMDVSASDFVAVCAGMRGKQ